MPQPTVQPVTEAPPPSSGDDFDVNELTNGVLAALSGEPPQPQPDDVPDDEDTPDAGEATVVEGEEQPEPTDGSVTEPEPDSLGFGQDGSFAAPVLGKYKTVADVVKAVQHQAAELSRRDTVITELRKAVDSVKEEQSLSAMARTDPEKAKREIDRIAQEKTKTHLDDVISFQDDPRGFISKVVMDVVTHKETQDRRRAQIASAYGDLWSGMEATRAEIMSAVQSGELPIEELAHLAAMGYTVREKGGLPGKVNQNNKPTAAKPVIAPAPPAAGVVPETKKPPRKISAADAMIEQLDRVFIPGIT